MADAIARTIERRKSRRALLTVAVAAAGAAGLKSLSGVAEAGNIADGQSYKLGETNSYTGSTTTNVIGTVNGQFIQYWNGSTANFAPAFVALGKKQGLIGAINDGGGYPAGLTSGNTIGVGAQGGQYGVYAVAEKTGGAAVYGQSGVGNALHGKSTSSGGSGLVGEATSGYGAYGKATSGDGVRGDSSTGRGVLGAGDIGVLGNGGTTGVEGSSSSGTGVVASTTTGTGLRATASDASGIALHAEGPVRFQTAGTDKFTANQSSKVISGVPTPPGCKILVTLNQNPGPGNALKYVKRTSDTGFTVFLLKPVTGNVSFSYFVIR